MLNRSSSRQQSVFARDEQHLADNLTRSQVAFQAHQRCHTELAIHRAAHLAGDADRVALAFRHQNGLDGAAVGKPQEITPRAVDRVVDGGRRPAAQSACGRELVAEAAGSVEI